MNLPNLQWIFSPLTQYGALALTLIGCLILFLSLKRDVYRVRLQTGKLDESARSDFGVLAQDMQNLKRSLHEIETSPATPAPAQSLNLTRRGQALRMHRRGEPVSTIASALQTPQNEIQLLLKVQQLINPEKR